MADDDDKVVPLRPSRLIAAVGPQYDVWRSMSDHCVFRHSGHLHAIPVPANLCGHEGTCPEHKCDYSKCPLIKATIK